MARTATVWFRKQTGWYMTTIGGVRHKLSKDKKEAEKAFHALMATREDNAPVGSVPTYRKLADLYLEHTKAKNCDKVFRNRLHYLKLFCDSVGRKFATEMKPHMVTAFIDKQGWAESTAVTARGAIVGCLRYAVREGYIPVNPLAAVKVGKTEARKRVLTNEERAKVRAACKGGFLEFLTACELTGARPFSEVSHLTADMIDWQAGVIEFQKHKNAKKGKARTIYLTPPLEALLKRVAEKHPTGLLFRTRKNGQWNSSAVCYHMRKSEKELGLPRLKFYCWRSCAITNALESGLTADIAAELFGNSSATIARHYNQLSERREALKAAAAKAVR